MTESWDALTSVVTAARVADPSIETVRGLEIARACAELLVADPEMDAAELARRCVAAVPEADVSWVAHIARATVGEPT